MVKTVGILTYHAADNFGAVLQAFALQRTIKALGASCSIIDYREPQTDAAYRLFHAPRNRSSIRRDLLILMNLSSHLKARNRYEQFRLVNLELTTKSFRSLNDLLCESFNFDAYVSGSDQVWHPNLLDRSCGAIYFLDFAGAARRVAYAPSFGLTQMPVQYRERAASFIRQFDFLSAREDTGCAMIQDLTGRTADHVLDPTLLQPLAEYNKAAVAPTIRGGYILLYPMQMSDHLCNVALTAQKRLKLPIVAVLRPDFEPWRFTFADKLVYNAGPAEFLGWMKNAAFICTNSFHGTCFSIIYRKNFLGVPHLGAGTRLNSLLKYLDLLNRQIDEPGDLNINDPRLETIDYSSVEPRLDQAVKRSLDFLRKALA